MLKKNAKKIISLSDLSNQDLDKKYSELKKEHQELRFKIATGGIPNVKRISQLKKEVARILTIKRQRELANVEAEANR